MSKTRTLAELRADVEELTDIGTTSGTSFIKQATLNGWIEQGGNRLVDELYKAHDDRYFEAEHVFDTDLDVTQYLMPTDFYKLYQVDAIIDNIQRPVRRADRDELGWGTFTALGSSEGCTDAHDYLNVHRNITPRYRLHRSGPTKTVLELIPRPQKVYCVKVRYGPTAIFFSSGGTPQQSLSADTDYVDVNVGWAEFIVYDAAIKVAIREKEDPSEYLALRNSIRDDIVANASTRDHGVRRVRETWDTDPWPEDYYRVPS